MSLNGLPQAPKPAQKQESNGLDLEGQKNRLGRNTQRLNDVVLRLARKTGAGATLRAAEEVQEGKMKAPKLPEELLGEIGRKNATFRQVLGLGVVGLTVGAGFAWPHLADHFNFAKEVLVNESGMHIDTHNVGELAGIAGVYTLAPAAMAFAKLKQTFKLNGYQKQLQEAGAKFS
jgi:hypothetical protein